jgi:hypothetical protein
VDVPFDSKIIFKDYSSKEQPNSASLQTNIFGTNMLDVYPNPAKNILNIKYQSEDNHSLKAFAIINSIGEIIYKGRFNENQESLALNIKNFKPGLYYFKANINGNIVSKKIVIN